MGLFATTTGTSVSIYELGIVIADPVVDHDLGTQFNGLEIKRAVSLTTAIRSGVLIWRKTAGGTIEAPTNYDEDYWITAQENTSPGAHGDDVALFSDLLKDKSGKVAFGIFSGNPKKATVTFTVAFPDNNYSVSITGSDGRSWIVESQSAAGFTINAQANALLTGPVQWTAIYNGESN